MRRISLYIQSLQSLEVYDQHVGKQFPLPKDAMVLNVSEEKERESEGEEITLHYKDRKGVELG